MDKNVNERSISESIDESISKETITSEQTKGKLLLEGTQEYSNAGKNAIIGLNSSSQDRNYIPDEDYDGGEASHFRDDDECIYTSETELEAFCNQSDSIEADQYKMDPEVDQMKDEDVDRQHFTRERICGDKFYGETEGIAGNGKMELHPTSPSSNQSADLDASLSFQSGKYEVVKPQTEKKFYTHPAVTESFKLLLNINKEISKSGMQSLESENSQKVHFNDLVNNMEKLKPVNENVPELGSTNFTLGILSVQNDAKKEDDFMQFSTTKEGHVTNAEGLEQQLQKLLWLSNNHLPERNLYNEAEVQETPTSVSQFVSCDERFMKKCKEMLPLSHKYLLEPFVTSDSFDRVNKADLGGLMAENKVLQTSLEEETFRRKHCEKQITFLNKKLMDLQQVVAVAMSLDRMKDDAIKGIDKMLSKSVQQWRAREEDQQMLVEKICNENRSIKCVMRKQQDALLKYESHIEELTNKMKEDRLKSEIENKELLNQLQETKDRLASMQENKNSEINYHKRLLDDEQRSKLKMEKEFQERLSNIQTTFECEKLKWKSNEAKLEREVKSVQEECSEKMELEKMRNEKLQNIIEELNMSIKQSKNDRSLLEAQLQEQILQKECMKNTIESLEEKYKLQLNEMQKEISSKTRNEIAEVTQKLVEYHKWEIEELMKSHTQEIEVIKMECNERCSEAMNDLSDLKDEVKKLRKENEMLNNFRRDTAAKMQFMLQVHQEEALKLFGIEAASKDNGNSLSNYQNKALQDIIQKNSSSRIYINPNEMNKQDKHPCASEPDIGNEPLGAFFSASTTSSRSMINQEERRTNHQQKDIFDEQSKFSKKNRTSRHPVGNNSRMDNFAIPSKWSSDTFTFRAKDHPYPENTQPTRLQSQAKDLPTNDTQEENVDQNHKNSNSLERCNILRQYIQMMLQRDPATIAKSDQSTIQPSRKGHNSSDT